MGTGSETDGGAVRPCCRKRRALFVFGVMGLALAWMYFNGASFGGKSGWISAVETVEKVNRSVAVYYFHGTIRCEKCLEIERISRETVESFYENELPAGRMSWQSVDYMLRENEHFFDDFNLKLPSLAVEKRVDGEPVARLVLSNTWDKVEVPEDMADYVITGIEGFLDNQESVPVGGL